MKRARSVGGCSSDEHNEGEGSVPSKQESDDGIDGDLLEASESESKAESQPQTEEAEEDEPEGPTCYEDIFLWPQRLLQNLRSCRTDDGSFSAQVLQDNLRACGKVVLTTSFSGIGSAEVAASMIAQQLQADSLWPRGNLQVHSVCEKEPSCRKVLMAHSSPCRADHMFKDIVHSFSAAVEKAIKQKLGALREAAQESAKSADVGASRPEVMRPFVEEFHCFAEGLLQQTVVQDHLFCEEHLRMCPRVPARDKDKLWVEVAGTPCVAFCRGGGYGGQLGWLHDTSVLFLAWVAFLRQAQPDVIVHECVEAFDHEVLRRYLNSGCPANQPLYQVASVDWDVLWQGLPVSRHRRYTVCVRSQHGPPCLRLEEPGLWRRLVFAKQCVGSDIFFRAPPEDTEAIRTSWAVRQKLPTNRINSKGVPKPWAWEALLSARERSVVMSMRDRAQQLLQDWEGELLDDDGPAEISFCDGDPDRTPVFRWLVNLAQSSLYQPRLSPTQLTYSHLPTVVCSSRFFLDSNNHASVRAVHPLEHHGMQCQPVYLQHGHAILEACNMESVLRSAMEAGVTLAELSKMAGNSMNIAAVGQILLFALAVHTWSKDSSCEK
eukprot:s646_g5.t1